MAVVAALLMVAGPAALLAGSASAEPAIPGLSVTSKVVFERASFVLTGDVVVHSGGRLVLDNTTVLVRMQADFDISFRVEAGGELVIVNHSRITTTFISVGFSVHYTVFVEPGAHLVFQNSTIDSAWAVGVGDEDAVIENVTISNTLLGLYGFNLTVQGARFLGDTIGFWVDGRSTLRGVVAQSNLVYGGILSGNSSLEGGTFLDNTVGDLQLLDNSSAKDTTHRRSARGYILNGNTSIENVSVRGALYGAVQLGDPDFRYGCGVFNGTIPAQDLLNLHLFVQYYRVNNTVQVTDLDVSDSAAGFLYARQVWRRAVTIPWEAIDDCFGDPPPPVPAEPLFNTIQWNVTRPTSVVAAHNEFNGTINIQPGGSLHLEGGDLLFISDGYDQHVTAGGGSLALQDAHLHSAFANYSSDLLEFGKAVAPGVDIDVQSGAVSVRDSLLQNLGTDPDRTAPAGLVVREGAGPLVVERTRISDTTRGFVVGCCSPGGGSGTAASFEGLSVDDTGPLVEVWDSSVGFRNSSLGNGSSPTLWASGGSSHADFYSTAGGPAGPGSLTIDRYGELVARVVWPDQRPVVGANFTAVDTVTEQSTFNATTDAGGWTPFTFVKYATTTWDGSSQTSGSPHPFRLEASFRNVSAVREPVDLSVPATHTLVIPDEQAPVLNISLEPVHFTTFSFGTVSGTAQDMATGVSLVEAAIDAGGFTRVTPAGPALEGLVNFSLDYSGLSNGIHAITFRAWDTVGNSGTASVLVIVDPLAPSLDLDQPFNYTTNTRDFNFTGRLSEPGAVVIGNNTATVTEDALRFSIPFHLATDSEIVLIVATDVAGNTFSWNIVVRLDQTPPVLNLTSPADGAFLTRPDIVLQGTMEPGATMYLNGVRLFIGGASSFSIPAVLAEGENALELREVDPAGNEVSVFVTVTLDTGIPPLDILEPNASRVLASKDFDIVLRTEVGATVVVENTSVVATESIVTVPYTLPDGRHSLSVAVTDLAGNSVRRVITVVVDTRSPLLSVSGGSGQSTGNATHRVLIQTEPGAFVRVGQWEAQADDAGVYSLNVRLHPGENTIHIESWDAAGNRADLVVTVTLVQPDPASPAGLALPTGGTIILLVVGAVLLAIAAPVARRAIRLIP